MSMSRLRLLQRPIGHFSKLSVLQLPSYSTIAKGETDLELSSNPESLPPLSSRWFAALQNDCNELRGKLYPPECVQRAESLQTYAEANWLALLAGRQGFLTEGKWRGLDNHQLFWGDVVSRHPDPSFCASLLLMTEFDV